MISSRPDNSASFDRHRSPDLVVVELQTTGAAPECDEIIQIGAAKVGADGSVSPYFSTFVRPRDRVSKRVMASTGVRYSDLAGAPSAPEALRALARFVDHVTGAGTEEPVVVILRSHARFIAAACARYSLPTRPQRFIDSMWFLHDLFATLFASESSVAALADVVIVSDATDLTEATSVIMDWLGVVDDNLPHPRPDGVDIRIRLFAAAVRRLLLEPSHYNAVSKIRARTCEDLFVASK